MNYFNERSRKTFAERKGTMKMPIMRQYTLKKEQLEKITKDIDKSKLKKTRRSNSIDSPTKLSLLQEFTSEEESGSLTKLSGLMSKPNKDNTPDLSQDVSLNPVKIQNQVINFIQPSPSSLDIPKIGINNRRISRVGSMMVEARKASIISKESILQSPGLKPFNPSTFLATGIDEGVEYIYSCNDESDLEKWEANDEKREILQISDLIIQEDQLSQDQEDQIVNYLKQVKYIKQRNNFKHLKSIQIKKLISALGILLYQKGEFIFHQDEPADNGYLILYGTVIFLRKQVQTFTNITDIERKILKRKIRIQELDNREKKTISLFEKDDVTCVEELTDTGFSQSQGELIGENAMMNQNKGRALSGLAKTQCILLVLNREAFDILIKEHLQKEKQELAEFVTQCIPIHDSANTISPSTLAQDVQNYFKQITFTKGQVVMKEGGRQEYLYFIHSGICGVVKKMKSKGLFGSDIIKEEIFSNIEPKEIIGEEGFCFNRDNSYTMKVTSLEMIAYRITYADFMKYKQLKKFKDYIAQHAEKRYQFIEKRVEEHLKLKNQNRKKFNSVIEKGKMNVFLNQEFKTKMDFTSPTTKKKMQIIFMRKELQDQRDKELKEQSLFASQSRQSYHKHYQSAATISNQQPDFGKTLNNKMFAQQATSTIQYSNLQQMTGAAFGLKRNATNQMHQQRQSVGSNNQFLRNVKGHRNLGSIQINTQTPLTTSSFQSQRHFSQASLSNSWKMKSPSHRPLTVMGNDGVGGLQLSREPSVLTPKLGTRLMLRK